MLINKTKIKENAKKVMVTIFWCILSVGLYFIINREFIEPKSAVDTKVYSYSDISTAINEQHQLIITDRKTGLYKIYSDSVLVGIHGMWSTYVRRDFIEKSTK